MIKKTASCALACALLCPSGPAAALARAKAGGGAARALPALPRLDAPLAPATLSPAAPVLPLAAAAGPIALAPADVPLAAAPGGAVLAAAPAAASLQDAASRLDADAGQAPSTLGAVFDGGAGDSGHEGTAWALEAVAWAARSLLRGAARSSGKASPMELGELDGESVSRAPLQDPGPSPRPDSEEAARLRGELKPLVGWLADFHVQMRREFPKADFSMRDLDAFLNYLRVMRHEKLQRPDPRAPGGVSESSPTDLELIAGAAGNVYRDRVGLGHPEDFAKREQARARFDSLLNARLASLPKEAAGRSLLQKLPRQPRRALPKPFAELQKEYLDIFPELAADRSSYVVDRKPASFIRDKARLPGVESRIAQIKAAVSTRDPLLLLGDSAVSKSFLIKAYYETILNPFRASAGKPPIPVVAVGVKPNMGSRELVGRYAPRPVMESKDGRTRATSGAEEFAYLAGHMARAMIMGYALVFEEITNAQPEFLETINYYLTHGYLVVHQKGGEPLVIHPHPDFRLFATGNWSHFTGRNSQSQAFWSRWRVKIWEEYSVEETGYILAAKYGIEEYLARQMAIFQEALATQLKARKTGRRLQGQYALNLRTLEWLALRYSDDLKRLGAGLGPRERLKVLGKEVFDVYGSMLSSPGDKKALLDLMDKSFAILGGALGGKTTFSDLKLAPEDLEPELVGYEERAGELVVVEKVLGEFRFPKGPGGRFTPGPEARLTMVPEVARSLFRLLRAWRHRRPYLLMGERSAGKTRLVQFAAHLLDMPLFYIAHSQESSLKELIGGYYPRADAKADSSRKDGGLPPLVWLDGKEIQAMEWGRGTLPEEQVGAWLFEDDVNLSTMQEMRNTVLDEGVQATPYRQVAAGPNFWSVQAANPPDPLRYGGRKQLSPAHLSRRQVAWQEELDAPDADPAKGAGSSLVETVLDRLLGSVRSEKPLTGLAAALPAPEGGGIGLESGRAPTAAQRARIDEALAIMSRVPAWRPLHRRLTRRPVSFMAAELKGAFGAMRAAELVLDARMLRDASPEFVAFIISKEASHYQEGLVQERIFAKGAAFWLEEGERHELFRSLAGWVELGRPADKDYRGYLEGGNGWVPYWLSRPDDAEEEYVEGDRSLARLLQTPLWTLPRLARRLTEQALRLHGPDAARQAGARLSRLARYYRAALARRRAWLGLRARSRDSPRAAGALSGLASSKSPGKASGEGRPEIDEFLKLFPGLDPSGKAALARRLLSLPSPDISSLGLLAGLQERFSALATGIGLLKDVRVRYDLGELEPGGFPYFYDPATRTITLNAWALLRDLRKPDGLREVFGAVDHEAGHVMASQFLPADGEAGLDEDELLSFFFESDSRRLLLNAFEDPRMENWLTRHFPGTEKDLDAVYADFIKGESSGELPPHMQYVLGVVYWARAGKTAPFVTDAGARKALEKTSAGFQDIFETIPPGYSLSREEHARHARLAAEKVRSRIWPHYEPLVRASEEKLRPACGGKEGRGRSGRPPAPAPDQGCDGSGSSRQAVEESSGKLADKLGGAVQRARLGGGSPGRGGARVSEDLTRARRASGSGEEARRLMDDIEGRLHDFFERSLSLFEDRLARMHEATERLAGLLANVFYKNAEPQLRGHYEDGDEPDLDRLMDVIGSGGADLDFWQRLVENSRRRFKVSIVLDLSGSMSGDAKEGLLDSLAMLLTVCQRLGIDVSVKGFDESVYALKPFGVVLDVAGMARLEEKVKSTGGGFTSDGDALKDAVEEMKGQDAERRVVFIVTDGDGNGGAARVADVLDEARGHGIEVVAAGVGDGMDYVRATYEKTAYVLAPRADQLPEPLAELLLRNVWAAYDEDVDTRLHVELGALAGRSGSGVRGLAGAFAPRHQGDGALFNPQPLESFAAGGGDATAAWRGAAFDPVSRRLFTVGRRGKGLFAGRGSWIESRRVLEDGTLSREPAESKTLWWGRSRGGLAGVAFDPSSRLLFTASESGFIQSRRVDASGAVRWRPARGAAAHRGERVGGMACSSEHGTLYSADERGFIEVRRVGADGAVDQVPVQRLRAHGGEGVYKAAYDPRARTLVTAGMGGVLEVRRVGAGGLLEERPIQTLKTPGAGSVVLVYDHAGGRVLTSDWEGRVSIRRVGADGTISQGPIRRFALARRDYGVSYGAAYDPVSGSLFTAGYPDVIERRLFAPPAPRGDSAESSPDASLVPRPGPQPPGASDLPVEEEGAFAFLKGRLGSGLRGLAQSLRPGRRDEGAVSDLQPLQKTFATGGGDKTAVLRDAVYDPGSRLLFTVGKRRDFPDRRESWLEIRRVLDDGRVREEPVETRTWRGGAARGGFTAAAFDPVSRVLFTATTAGVIQTRRIGPSGRIARWRRARSVAAHQGRRVTALVYSRELGLLLSFDEKGVVEARRYRGGRLENAPSQRFAAHRDNHIYKAVYDHATRALVTASIWGSMEVRHVGADGRVEERAFQSLRDDDVGSTVLAFDPAGRRVITSDWEGRVVVRHVASDGSLSRRPSGRFKLPPVLRGQDYGAVYEPDSGSLIIAGNPDLIERLRFPPRRAAGESSADLSRVPEPGPPRPGASDLPVEDDEGFPAPPARRGESGLRGLAGAFRPRRQGAETPLDPETLQEIAARPGEKAAVFRDAAFDPASRTLFAVGKRKGLLVMEGSWIESRKVLDDGSIPPEPFQTLTWWWGKPSGGFTSAVFDPASRVLFTAGPASLHAWSVDASGMLGRRPIWIAPASQGMFGGVGRVNGMAYASDIRVLFSVTETGLIEARRIRDGGPEEAPRSRVRAHGGREIFKAAYDPRRRALVTVGRDGFLEVREVGDHGDLGKILQRVPIERHPRYDFDRSVLLYDRAAGIVLAGGDDGRGEVLRLAEDGTILERTLQRVTLGSRRAPRYGAALDGGAGAFFVTGNEGMISRLRLSRRSADDEGFPRRGESGLRGLAGAFRPRYKDGGAGSSRAFFDPRPLQTVTPQKSLADRSRRRPEFHDAVFDPDSRLLISVGERDGFLRRRAGWLETRRVREDGTVPWDPLQSRTFYLGKAASGLSGVAFDPATRTLLVATLSGHLQSWRVDGSGRIGRRPLRVAAARPGARITALAFAPDPGVLFLADDKGLVEVRRVRDGLIDEAPRQIFQAHRGREIFSMAYDPRARTLLTSGYKSGLELRGVNADGTVAVAPRQVLAKANGGQIISDIILDPAGEVVFLGGWHVDGEIRRVGADGRIAGEPLQRFKRHRGGRRGMVYDPASASLIVAGYDGKIDRFRFVPPSPRPRSDADILKAPELSPPVSGASDLPVDEEEQP